MSSALTLTSTLATMIINTDDPDSDADHVPPPPLPPTVADRPASAPPDLEHDAVATLAPRPQRSHLYLPHTLNPQRCCSAIACDNMTTTVMCASHYPSVEHARSVHAAVVALRKLCVVVAAMRGGSSSSSSGVTANATELGKAMTMLFDLVWFNRDTLIAEMRDVITMRRVFVEYCECLSATGAAAASQRFRDRHQWILWWPDHDVVC